MTDPGERLRCYDTQMAAMGAPLVAVPPAATPAPLPTAPLPAAPAHAVAARARRRRAPQSPPAAPPTRREQKFGAEDLQQSRARTRWRSRTRFCCPRIASIHEVRPKLWLIVLANGQIWMQDGTQITMFFRAGYDVRIEKGLLRRLSHVDPPDRGEELGEGQPDSVAGAADPWPAR